MKDSYDGDQRERMASGNNKHKGPVVERIAMKSVRLQERRGDQSCKVKEGYLI